MIVVSNTTPIISLSSINKIDLLSLLFKKVSIPTAVYNELKYKNSYGYSEIESGFFKVIDIKERSQVKILLDELDRGESESIVLAKEINADVLIIDDRMGYLIAKSLGIFTITTLTVLKESKRKKYISEVRPLLDEMIQKGRWYSRRVRDRFLKEIGEF